MGSIPLLEDYEGCPLRGIMAPPVWTPCMKSAAARNLGQSHWRDRFGRYSWSHDNQKATHVTHPCGTAGCRLEAEDEPLPDSEGEWDIFHDRSTTPIDPGQSPTPQRRGASGSNGRQCSAGSEGTAVGTSRHWAPTCETTTSPLVTGSVPLHTLDSLCLLRLR
jgi:hypothetical protein